MKPRARIAVVALALASACVEDRGRFDGFVGEWAATITSAGQLRLETTFEMYAIPEGGVYLHGGSVVVRDASRTFEFQTPTISAPDFPLEESPEGYAGTAVPIAIEVPSPFDDLQTFDAYCPTNARSADITLSFYVPANDEEPAEPPTFESLVSTAVSIALTGTPPAAGVFGTSGIYFGPVTGTDEQVARPPELVASTDTGVIFMTGFDSPNPDPIPYRASAVGVFPLGGATGLEAPQIGADAAGGFQLAGRNEGGLEILVEAFDAQRDTLWFLPIEASAVGGAAYDVLRVAEIAQVAGGTRVVVQSSHPIVGPTGDVVPPADKHYGSFSIDIDAMGQMVAAVSNPRDVVAVVALAAGGAFTASTELPPRTAPPGLLVERRDATGALVFSHEEPVLAYAASIHPLGDGGALVVVEDREIGRTTIVLRLAADGTVFYRVRVLGEHPSLAARPDGSALLAFTGTIAGLGEPAQAALPDRAIPALVELAPDGTLRRAAQLGCEGWGFVGASQDGTPILVGSFGAWLTLGGASRVAARSQLVAAVVQ